MSASHSAATHTLLIHAMLVATAVACWVGALGMWRMREPIQALQYMCFPASIASVFLTIAVALQTGASQATAKCVAIAAILFGINSIVTHASARAFRARELGHWEPRPGDDIEFLPQKPQP